MVISHQRAGTHSGCLCRPTDLPCQIKAVRINQSSHACALLQVNYPGPEQPYTRIVEYKHKPNQPAEQYKKPGTVIFKEYSVDGGDPYYPVPNPENQALYEKYKAMADMEPGVCFVGRLASYKYFNMDQAILTSLEMYDELAAAGKI